VLTRRKKKNKTSTPEAPKVTVARRVTKETLVGSATLSNRGGLSVNEKDSRRDSLSPKVRWKLKGKQESTRGLKNMTMLTLGNTILSMSTRAGELRKSALCSKKTTMRIRNILACRISTESTNGRIKLCANHGGELLINRQELTTRGHEIDPDKP